MKREPLFKTEADLCAAFIEAMTPQGWTPYNETAGWDILLVNGDGTQIGIQAKLKFNMKVLMQAIEYGNGWQETGPDFRAIMLPARECASRDLCSALGLTVIEVERGFGRVVVRPEFDGKWGRGEWHYCNPKKRHRLPEHVPDVPAGVSGPAQLTEWKIAALQISAILELRGWVSRHDFRLAGIDYRRWTQDWLEPVPDRKGAWRWRDGKDMGFATQHPTIYQKVLADVKKKGISAVETGEITLS